MNYLKKAQIGNSEGKGELIHKGGFEIYPGGPVAKPWYVLYTDDPQEIANYLYRNWDFDGKRPHEKNLEQLNTIWEHMFSDKYRYDLGSGEVE